MGRPCQGQQSPGAQPLEPVTPSLTVLRTDTVFAKLPIHNLAKRDVLSIRVVQSSEQGSQELYWQVSPSAAYGPPQQLAYKLDTLLINRHLDALKRPLPTMIRLGSLRRICDDLGLRVGRSVADIKKAFHQNAGAYITAKLTYRDIEGKERRLEAGFNRYGVVFTGESLPGGASADAVYILLNESYRQVLNAAPTRPVDYDYLTLLRPLAQRFYELLSFRMYAALKYQHPKVSMRYSELCQFAPQQRYTDGARMSKQMYKVHQPHLHSGYLIEASTESVVDDEGRPDWILHYVPGPKAHADYQAFSSGKHQERRLYGAREGTTESTVSIPTGNAGLPSEHPPAKDATAQAISLVRRFHHQVHQVSDVRPHPREIDHAASLIDRHGQTFADFFLSFACQTARRSDFTPHVFGGLMRYEGRALAAYRRQQAKLAREAAEAAEAREARLHQQYEQESRTQLSAYRDGLSPAALTVLEAQVREELMATEPIPRSVLGARLKAELHDRLALQAGVPSYEVWLRQREETSHGRPHAQPCGMQASASPG